MNKIKRVSLCFRVLFQLVFCFMVLDIIFLGYGWLSNHFMNNAISWHFATATGFSRESMVSQTSYPIMNPLTFPVKIAAFLLDCIPVVISMLVVYFLIKLFRLYERGEIFLLTNVRYIRNIGYSLLIGQLINPLVGALKSLALTWNNPPHHHVIQVTIDGTNLGILLTSIVVILISWIMAEGHKLQEEQDLTV